MKKSIILAGLAIVLGLTACDDFELPNPPAQSNPDEAVFKGTDLTITQGDVSLDLMAANNAGEPVKVAEVANLVNFPSTYTLTFGMEISTNADFAKSVEVAAAVSGDDVTVSADALNGAIYNTFTHSPEIINIYARFIAYAENGTTKIRLGGDANSFYATGWEYQVKPFDPNEVIEDAYYLIGTFCGWDVTKAIKFNKAVAGSQYDNGVFTIKVDVDAAAAAAGYEWKVVPASGYASGSLDNAIGVEAGADGPMSGTLVKSAGSTANRGVIKAASPYLISIDLVAKTYDVTFAIDYLYIAANGTSKTDFSKMMRMATKDYVNYAGASYINRQWRIYGQPSLTGMDLVQKGDAVTSDAGVVTGQLVDNSTVGDDAKGKQMLVPGRQLYWIQANLVNMTYKASPINVISLIGQVNEWNVDTALDLTPSNNYKTWTISNVKMPAGEYKFCVNHAWTLSFGGSVDQIEENGGNLKLDEAGNYDFVLNFETLPYQLTVTKR